MKELTKIVDRHALKYRCQYRSKTEAKNENMRGDANASEVDDGKYPVHEKDAAKTLPNSSPVQS